MELHSFFKILFQRGTYDMNTGEAIKNELKVSILLEFLYQKPSSNNKISYTLVSLINHDGDWFYCGHYVSNAFDANIGLWWHRDDNSIPQTIDLPTVFYIRESQKQTKGISGSTYILFVFCIRTSHMTK